MHDEYVYVSWMICMRLQDHTEAWPSNKQLETMYVITIWNHDTGNRSKTPKQWQLLYSLLWSYYQGPDNLVSHCTCIVGNIVNLACRHGNSEVAGRYHWTLRVIVALINYRRTAIEESNLACSVSKTTPGEKYMKTTFLMCKQPPSSMLPTPWDTWNSTTLH